MDNYNLSMYQAVKDTAQKHPREDAIYYQGKRISYAKFLRLINKTSDILANKLGIRDGDMVLLAQPNIPDVLIIFYALNRIGAITNFVHPFTPYNQLRSIYEKTHSKVAILFEQRVAKEVEAYREFSNHVYVTRIENYLPFFKKIFYHTFLNRKIRKKLGKDIKFNGFNYFHNLKAPNKIVAEHSFTPKKLAVMLHSGSTTGAPKTICHCNEAFNFLSSHYEEFCSTPLENMVGKSVLSVLPSFHGFGLCITMHLPLSNGSTCALVPKFSPKEVVKVMNHTKMFAICGVPSMYEKLVSYKKFANNKRLNYLIDCFCGGDSMNISLKERWDSMIAKVGGTCQIFEGYGLTEAIAVNCVNTFNHHKDGSIGFPASGAVFKIIDEDENELKPNEIGEICLKSDAVMLHYFEDEEATKRTFTKDGFLKTGDIGYIDEDGYIFFKTRKKRIVKVSGVAVFPSEIERLIENIAGVIAVCAIQIPDPLLISAIKVYVVAKYFDEEGMRRTIKETCQKYLLRWAVPKEIEFVDELPMTMLGKVDFKKVQEQEDSKRKGLQ